MCWQWLASKRSLLQATWASTSNKPYKPGCDSKLQRFRNQRLVFKGGKVARINMGGRPFCWKTLFGSLVQVKETWISCVSQAIVLLGPCHSLQKKCWKNGGSMVNSCEWSFCFGCIPRPSRMPGTTKSITLGLINLDHLYESSLSISIITGGFPSQTIVHWCPLSLELGHRKSKAAQEPKEFGSQINVRNNGSS